MSIHKSIDNSPPRPTNFLTYDKLQASDWVTFTILVGAFIFVKMQMLDRWFGAPTTTDEFLYIFAARSFFNQGQFLFQAQPSTLNYPIYPALLSLVYYIYTPENILFIMRLFGTIVYSLGFIPVFLLAQRILKSTLEAYIILIIVFFIPETSYVGFMSQEITHFPLMMLAFYLIYLFIEEKKYKFSFSYIILAVLFFLLSENKAIGIVVIITFVLYLIYEEFFFYRRFYNYKSVIREILFIVVPYVILTFLMWLLKQYISVGDDVAHIGGVAVSSRVIDYFTENTLLYLTENIKGILYYIYYFFFFFILFSLILFFF
jgi:hypothetical protein